jgi:proteasome lid subunit RPN8/RPN11
MKLCTTCSKKFASLISFTQINAKEKIVGWYSTGPKIKKADIDINEIFMKYNTNPVFIVIKVQENVRSKE